MRTFGKLLQVAGLVLLPVSMMMQLTGGVRAATGGGFTVSAMLLLMVLGVCLFSAGADSGRIRAAVSVMMWRPIFVDVAGLLCGHSCGPVLFPPKLVDRSIVLPPADVEQLDAASAAHLENAKRFLAERQWSEAVESIRRVQETEPSRLVKVEMAQPIAGFERYVTAAEYCQWRLAALAAEAPEALAHYRRLVDSLAEAWLREGEKTNDERLLRRIVEQAFASRSGDDALLKLGDLALARGDHSTARAAWQQINANSTVPPAAAKALSAAAGTPLWQSLRQIDFAAHGN